VVEAPRIGDHRERPVGKDVEDQVVAHRALPRATLGRPRRRRKG
jgi:hypothetical protein